MAMHFGNCRIGWAVGLDYFALRKQVAKAKERQLNVTASLIEVPAWLLLSASSMFCTRKCWEPTQH